MVTVRLQGVHRVKARLSDGRAVIYYYAWRGGPRLPGLPGSPEFVAAYNAAHAERSRPRVETLQSVLDAYANSAEFIALAHRTQDDYVKMLARISAEFGDFPIEGLKDRRSRAIFLKWRDELAKASRRQADYAMTVFARALSWAWDRGMTPGHPLERIGKLYHGSRAENVWTEADEAALLSVAPPPLRLAFLMAIWTGQRQGDLLRMTWAQYDGAMIRLKQSKRGARVAVPVAAPLKAALDAEPRRAVTILTNADGLPWRSGFSSYFAKVCRRAGVTGLRFSDLRGTAVTRMAVNGATVPEIAAITGHRNAEVSAILEAHYLARDPALAASAIRKLETKK